MIPERAERVVYDPNATRHRIGSITLTAYRYSDGMDTYAIKTEGLSDQEVVDLLDHSGKNAQNSHSLTPRPSNSACHGPGATPKETN